MTTKTQAEDGDSPRSGRRGRPAATTREGALEHAVERFTAGDRLDLSGLATDLGVGRTTIHNWFGTRDDLLCSVLIATVVPMFAEAGSHATGTGGERLVTGIDAYNHVFAAHTGLQAFIRRERDTALRLITDRDGRIHPGAVATFTTVIEQAARHGYDPPIAPATLARGLIKLADGVLFVDAPAGPADLVLLRAVQATLLGLPELAYAGDGPPTRR